MGTQSGVGPRSQEWKKDSQVDMQTARVQVKTSTKGVFCGGHRGFGGFKNGPGEETPDVLGLTETAVAHHPNPPWGP